MTAFTASLSPFSADGWGFSATTPSSLPLRTLVRLRWLAVIGQTTAVLFVHLVLGFPVPLGWCLLVIALSAWLNIFFSLRWRPSMRVTDRHAGFLLVYDILQLAILLYLTGGLENPFSFLFLVPVTVSATSLPMKWTMSIGALAFVCVTFLTWAHLPLPWYEQTPFHLPPYYVGGMWTALVSGVVFSAIYARRIAEEARQMSAALSATELVLAREQRLSALDGLAAAAAHELGTPLATIALVAKELKRELPANSPHAEDIDLLISQAARCRDILSKLANRDAPADDVFDRVGLEAMIEDIVAPLRGSDVAITIDAAPADNEDSPEPVLKRNPAISFGLGNIVENAADFAASQVEAVARWTDSTVTITVRDDGPGFAQEIIDRLGDPFVTTRPGYGPNDSDDRQAKHEGMGLGFFIAKTLLERSGATVSLANVLPPEHGANVTVSWPRRTVDVGERGIVSGAKAL